MSWRGSIGHVAIVATISLWLGTPETDSDRYNVRYIPITMPGLYRSRGRAHPRPASTSLWTWGAFECLFLGSYCTTETARVGYGKDVVLTVFAIA